MEASAGTGFPSAWLGRQGENVWEGILGGAGTTQIGKVWAWVFLSLVPVPLEMGGHMDGGS